MKVVCVILGGGAGTRLWPLTRDRAKPAVPIAGKYRLVDIPISSCIRSGFREMFLLTQFNSVSLHEHVQSTYKFDQFHNGYVRILAAQQTPDSDAWYLGTADAVRKTFNHFMDSHPDLIVILSGDQLYRMNYAKMVEQHLQTGADVTIATKPVSRQEAGSLGIMRVNDALRITEFYEKPGTGENLDPLRAPMYEEESFLASMGIYIFNTPVLSRLLESDSSDFGKEIIPNAIESYNVFSNIYEGYWKDIGTIRSFWETNLSLADPVPEFSFYDLDTMIYTHMRYLPPLKINNCAVEQSLLSEGSIVSGERIRHSVLGIRSVIGSGTIIEDSVVMGNDMYELGWPAGNAPPLGIGRDCRIQNAIIDKNARIGDGCVITPEGKPNDLDAELFTIRDGVLVVPKNTVIPAGTHL
jgi:glucose-1-phosphate adenylyltransferase